MNGLENSRNAGLQAAIQLVDQWADNYRISAKTLKALEDAADEASRPSARDARNYEEGCAAAGRELGSAIRALMEKEAMQ